MSIVLPVIEFVWWQDSVLQWVKSTRSKDKPFVVSSQANVHVLVHHFRLVDRIGAKMVIVRVRLVEQHQVLSYYDTVLYDNDMLL